MDRCRFRRSTGSVPQLVIDLELNIACCKMLTHKMDSEILQLYQNAENRLGSQSKFKLMVKNGTLESLQKMAERQSAEKRSDSSSYLLQILRRVIFLHIMAVLMPIVLT
jgi:hypothetical protein